MASVAPGKVAMFIVANIAGGLLQVWILYAALMSLGRDHSMAVLLGDGGLFFVSTSLIVNSMLVLFAESKSKPSTSDMSVTGVAVLGGFTAVAIYIAVQVTNTTSNIAPFHDHVPAQMICAVGAFGYAAYVGGRTGYFAR